jgi:hypothetical protein
MQRNSKVMSTEILRRARLTDDELRGTCSPTRVALAVRAEWWHGTLEGAYDQARRGVATFVASPDAWRSPALLYLGAGRQALLEVVQREEVAIEAECTARVVAARGASRNDFRLAASHLIELADVLGPIIATYQSQSLSALVLEARSIAQHLQDDSAAASDPGAADAAQAAGIRFDGWGQLGSDLAVIPSALIASYDERATTGAEWDAVPALELVVALDLLRGRGQNVDRLKLGSLPPPLRLPRSVGVPALGAG